MNLRKLKVNRFTAAAARAAGLVACRSVESFVFVAGTGRCGTNTLAQLMSATGGVSAHHEPYPQITRRALEAANDGDDSLMMKTFNEIKIPRILWSARRSRWYVESSYLFILSFADAAVRYFGRRVQVVHLRRDPDAMARSFVARSQDPNRDPWLVRPSATKNLLQLAPLISQGGRFDHLYFRLLWYWYEVEARTAAFRDRFPEVQVHRMATEALGDLEQVSALWRSLGIPVTESLRESVGLRGNRSAKEPSHPAGVKPEDVAAFHDLCRRGLAELGVSTD